MYMTIRSAAHRVPIAAERSSGLLHATASTHKRRGLFAQFRGHDRFSRVHVKLKTPLERRCRSADLSGDRFAGVRGKEFGQCRDVVRIYEPLQGLGCERSLTFLFGRTTALFRSTFENLLDARAFNGTGQDGIRTDPLHRLPAGPARRRSCALIATMMVLNDMSTAPRAGCSRIPHPANTPAARGMATMLYPAAHHRFWIILR